MIQCDAELCPFWTGFGCVCAVFDLDPYELEEDDDDYIDW